MILMKLINLLQNHKCCQIISILQMQGPYLSILKVLMFLVYSKKIFDKKTLFYLYFLMLIYFIYFNIIFFLKIKYIYLK